MMLRRLFLATVILCFLVVHGIALYKLDAMASDTNIKPAAIAQSGD